MKTFLQAAAALAVVAIIAGLGFLFGRYAYPKCPEMLPPRIDTVVVRDTIRDTVLVPVNRYLVRIDTVRVKIAGDTVYVEAEVPIERQVFATADYRAEIEGFRPSLVSMDIYRRTQFIDRVQTVQVPEVKRWGIGIQAGYGATVYGGRVIIVPTVGVGVQYNIIRW